MAEADKSGLKIVHGSSEWMKQMAFVIFFNGERVVVRVDIESSTPSAPVIARDFRGRVVADNPCWPAMAVHGHYDPTFRHPGWLALG